MKSSLCPIEVYIALYNACSNGWNVAIASTDHAAYLVLIFDSSCFADRESASYCVIIPKTLYRVYGTIYFIDPWEMWVSLEIMISQH